MDYLVPKKADSESRNSQVQEEAETLDGGVTSFLYLKPQQQQQQQQQRGVLYKEVVLRRIRQRKRANKVRSAIQAVVGVGTETEWDHRWLDDAFSAP